MTGGPCWPRSPLRRSRPTDLDISRQIFLEARRGRAPAPEAHAPAGLGLWSSPATARIGIREGKLEEFKRLAAQCVQIVRTKDTGTLKYDLFLNADGTDCFVHERYRDSASGLEHMANIGPVMKPLSEICTMTGEVCGTPSPELRKSLDAAGVRIYAPFQSLSR